MSVEQSDLLTKAEAAERLRVSSSTVDRLRAQGEIAWALVGRQVRFRPDAIADYVQRAERPVRPHAEREVPLPRARTCLAFPPGPRRRASQVAANFDELFRLPCPNQRAEASGEQARRRADARRAQDARGELGCVITDGSFEASYDQNGAVALERSKPEASLMFFLLRLFEYLRQMGTVPAIDLREHGRSLEQ